MGYSSARFGWFRVRVRVGSVRFGFGWVRVRVRIRLGLVRVMVG